MQCPECGRAASEDDLFCGECGAILYASSPVEPSAAPVTAPPAAPAAAPPAGSAPAYVPTPRDPRAQAAFILGIISIVMIAAYCIPFFGIFSCFQPFVGIIAIILGNIARRDLEARGGPETDRRRARQGLIMGIVSTVLYAALVALTIVLGPSIPNQFNW
jgi:hypothetical protein